MPVDIIPAETVRAEDGLALSSRNMYLSAEERAEAPALYAELKQLGKTFTKQKHSLEQLKQLEQHTMAVITQRGWKPDYIAVRTQAHLLTPTEQQLDDATPLVVLAAAKLGNTRLIDNLEI
jgi:pantoate--beta-alanine ligase